MVPTLQGEATPLLPDFEFDLDARGLVDVCMLGELVELDAPFDLGVEPGSRSARTRLTGPDPGLAGDENLAMLVACGQICLVNIREGEGPSG